MTELTKFLVLMAHDGSLDFARLAEKSYASYAKRHGYNFRLETFYPTSQGRGHPSWQKLDLLQRTIEEGKQDWILWADTDTVITNHAIRLEQFLEPRDDSIWLYASRDWGEAGDWSAGVMLVRSCFHARKFFTFAGLKTQWADMGCWDQSAMHETWKENKWAQYGIKVLPRRLLQSVPRECSSGVLEPWQPWDFLCHATGIPSDQKRAILQKHFEKAMQSCLSG